VPSAVVGLGFGGYLIYDSDITRVTPGNTNTLGLYQHIGARGRSWSAVSRVKGFVEAVLPRSSYTMHRTEEREKRGPALPLQVRPAVARSSCCGRYQLAGNKERGDKFRNSISQ
jgi:hypothetical protein